jgi:hypothetical protein
MALLISRAPARREPESPADIVESLAVEAGAGAACAYEPEPRRKSEHSIKPALMSISDSCRYLGIGRSTFYSDILPLLETVRFGSRNLVVVSSMDDLIAARRQRAA